jgi:GDP-L-fucose synthase
MLNKNSKIYIAGHHGLVGSAIWNNLKKRGYNNMVGRSHKELDLTDQYAVEKFFDEERPDAVVLAAAFVGGIMANSLYRADFIMQNMKMQCNVISNAYSHGVKKLLFLGSTCIYPKDAPQPMTEDVLLTSPLEYTNEEYAIAKIAGLKMCESYNLQYGTNYIAVMPTNLYGPNDNFHLENSPVIRATFLFTIDNCFFLFNYNAYLFNSYTLCQVSWHVCVQSLVHSHVVCEELEGNMRPFLDLLQYLWIKKS